MCVSPGVQSEKALSLLQRSSTKASPIPAHALSQTCVDVASDEMATPVCKSIQPLPHIPLHQRGREVNTADTKREKVDRYPVVPSSRPDQLSLLPLAGK